MRDDVLGKLCEAGQIIFQEGDQGDALYVIQSGEVRITKNTPAGEVDIATLGEGEIFGEMALFDQLPRSATAIVAREARILKVDKRKFFSSISRDPTLAFKILESMSRRTRRINDGFTKLKKKKFDLIYACMDVDQTCSLILEEAREVIRSDNGSIMVLDPKMDRLEIRAAFGSRSDDRVLLREGEGIAGHVLASGRAEVVNDVASDSRFKAGGVDIGSLVCVPLEAREFNFGVITLSRLSVEGFNPEDLQLLGIVAVYASIAIQNAYSCSELQGATEHFLEMAVRLGV
jgi:CRP-like cAMP-binding protein